MTKSRAGRRLALAAPSAVAAIGSAAPANAADPDAQIKCDARLDRIIDKFYDHEERHGWEEAAEWWQSRWHAHYQSCESR